MTNTKKPKVYMGLPSTGDRWEAQLYALREIEKTYGDKVDFVYPTVWTSRIFHDYARSKIVEEFLATDCDVLWFLDSDVSPSVNVGDLLTEHYDKWDCAGAPYPVFMTPNGHDMPKITFTVYRSDGNGYQPADIPREGRDYVDGIATGCIMIKRHVFEKMQQPYFEFKYDEKTRELKLGEDIGFCKKVNELGYKFFIDFSMVCRHLKKVDLLDINNYCINEFNQRWSAHDQFLRSQLAKIALVKRKEPSSIILPNSPKFILP